MKNRWGRYGLLYFGVATLEKKGENISPLDWRFRYAGQGGLGVKRRAKWAVNMKQECELGDSVTSKEQSVLKLGKMQEKSHTPS